ncbi:imidazole glycerol phosphate synthase subunit HisH [Bacteroidetes bacterium endosymbiont of Geopemphigus sp.]|uniref:imidazole glycerol phosphate synthase subunit HisH n=1 Tax=Bacteroidetes bacterium endosymbiont of Geopemphigus sp. TaxID=2047937 RepID=UPI000CD1AD25|nr:imidazole glycerol phosphate synthase subunit HisH [Bacteroidetes bacterium endosymbiont of Geopemphigus sp.]
MKTVIVKYPAGNVQSIVFALERIGLQSIISDKKEAIQGADKVIIPGVGEARSAMEYFRKTGLDQLIPNLKQPVLGICLGMQLLCLHSEENNTPCLGIFDLPVKKFVPSDDSMLKVPHMGWNKLFNTQGVLFKEIEKDTYQYFVHSYYVPLSLHTTALSEYFLPYSAALQKDNFYALQFHPEKSGKQGQRIIHSFLKL